MSRLSICWLKKIKRELPPLDEDSYKKKPKLPKVDGLFKGDPPSVDAIFVSHGHGDHIGLIEDVNPEIPVYIGDMAARIYNTTAQFTGSKQLVNPCHRVHHADGQPCICRFAGICSRSLGRFGETEYKCPASHSHL